MEKWLVKKDSRQILNLPKNKISFRRMGETVDLVESTKKTIDQLEKDPEIREFLDNGDLVTIEKTSNGKSLYSNDIFGGNLWFDNEEDSEDDYKEDFEFLKTEINDYRNESLNKFEKLHEEMSSMRSELKLLNEKISSITKDFNKNIKVTDKLKKDFSSLSKELKNSKSAENQTEEAVERPKRRRTIKKKE